jgi:hypothetical protein
MDIKQEDLIKFWTWCGFEMIHRRFERGYKAYSCYWQYPDGQQQPELPELELSVIYNYAIPKLQKTGYTIELIALRHDNILAIITDKSRNIIGDEKANTPTEALYNAILKVIDNGVKHGQ